MHLEFHIQYKRYADIYLDIVPWAIIHDNFVYAPPPHIHQGTRFPVARGKSKWLSGDWKVKKHWFSVTCLSSEVIHNIWSHQISLIVDYTKTRLTNHFCIMLLFSTCCHVFLASLKLLCSVTTEICDGIQASINARKLSQ